MILAGEPLVISSTEDDQARRRFSMTAYTGGVVKPVNAPGRTVFNLAGMKTNGQRPALLQHKSDQLVGHTDAIENDGRELRAAGVISADTEHAAHVIQTAAAGFQWRVSVGIDPDQVENIPAGSSRTINGRRVRGPAYHVKTSVLKELSFVTVAADDDTAAIVANLKETEAMTLEQFAVDSGFNFDELTDQQLTAIQAAYDQTNGSNDSDPGTVAESIQTNRAEMAAECQRIDSIEKLTAASSNGQKIRGQAIAEGWDTTRTELELLRAERSTGPAIHAKSHESDATLDTLQAAMMLRAGFTLDDPMWSRPEAIGLAPRWLQCSINDDTRQRAMDLAHKFRDVSMLDICREATRLDGNYVHLGRESIIQASTSGASLSSIFSTNVNLSLLKTYSETLDSTTAWTSETDVANFLTQERTRLKPGSGLDRLARGGEATDATRSDVVETYSISRYAKKFSVSEQDLIDDRMNALSDQPSEMGRAAARIRPQLVYSILLSNPTMADGTALFHSTRGNSRTSATLAASTLTNALTDFRTQTEDGVTLNILPTHLIVPGALKFSASQLINSSETRHPAATAEAGTRNVFADEGLTLIVDSWLDNGMTNPSTGSAVTAAAGDWYVVSAQEPAIEVAYLRSSGRAPSVRTEPMPIGRYGISWAVSLDIGAKAVRPLSAHKSEA